VLPLATLLVTSLTAAQPAASPFATGNTYYQRGEWEQARQQYLAQMQQGPVTPPLWYNLGNVSLKLQQPGWAILYYERARLSRPRDANLQANLVVAMASRHVSASDEAPGWVSVIWDGLLAHFTLNELSVAAALLYLLSCGLLIWRLRGRDFRRRVLWLLIAALILMALAGALSLGKWLGYHDATRAVVVADGSLYSGPADSFPALRQVYQGEMAHLGRTNGIWREVVLENGTEGWLLQSAAEAVVAPRR
jgi:tetratricopeptide (TPR) repeat protein